MIDNVTKSLARDLIEISKTSETFMSVVESLVIGIDDDRIKESILNSMDDKKDDIMELIVDAYVCHYSAEELYACVKFFSTPLGNSYIIKSGDVAIDLQTRMTGYVKTVIDPIITKALGDMDV